jgi:glycosyltransferase involved in cell wall biosynthesis
MQPLRVLAVSHAAVVDVNQEPFAALAADGADVTVVAPRALRTDIRGRVALARLPGFAGTLVPLPLWSGGYSKAAGGQRGIHLIVYRGLARAIAAARPDVIFVEEEPFSFAALQCARVARKLGVPFVVHENQNIARRLAPPFEGIRRRVLRAASGVTVRNRAATALVRALGFTGQVEEFPHAVDPARYRTEVPRDANLPHPVVGFVGRLVPEKGILELVDALATVRGGSLLVVGDGPLRAEAEARASVRSVPHRFLGALAHDEVPPWYQAMDLVAIPSRATPTWMEQFGRVVIEANAAGVPVVAADSGDLGATVRSTGGGVVVPEADAAALADALRSLARDRARCAEIGDAGRRAVEERYTPGAVSARLHAFLREVARA